jgi:hypothetical protein
MEVYRDILQRRKEVERIRQKAKIIVSNQRVAEDDAAIRRRELRRRLIREKIQPLKRRVTAVQQDEGRWCHSDPFLCYDFADDDEQDLIAEFVKESSQNISDFFASDPMKASTLILTELFNPESSLTLPPSSTTVEAAGSNSNSSARSVQL